MGALLQQFDPVLQENKVIGYASHAMSEVEQRYSQIEREALAIVWGINHYRLYLLG